LRINEDFQPGLDSAVAHFSVLVPRANGFIVDEIVISGKVLTCAKDPPCRTAIALFSVSVLAARANAQIEKARAFQTIDTSEMRRQPGAISCAALVIMICAA
jgi:hypothetical protein